MLYTAILTVLALQGNPAEATQSPEQSVAPLERVVTKVGTIEITLGDVRAEVNRLVPMTFFHSNLPEEEKLSTYKTALGNLVDKSLIHQDAITRGLNPTEEQIRAEFQATLVKAGPEYASLPEEKFNELLNVYRPKVVRRWMLDQNEARFMASVPAIKEEALQQRYDMIRTELVSPEEARFQHILCKVPPAASKQEGAAVRKEIESLRERLIAGEDFGGVAKEYSDDIFASVGGDMGFVQKGAFTIRELDSAAFELADGDVSEVLTSLYGFHILLRLETRAPRQLSFEEVTADLRTGLEMEIEAVAREAWMAEMRKAIGVEELIKLEDDSLPPTD